MNARALTVIVDGAPVSFDGSRSVTLGRDPASDVVFPMSGISRQHARLEPTPEGWLLIDLGSTQGTWHEGSRVVTLPVVASTVVHLGTGAAATRVELVPGALARPGGGLRPNVADATEVGSDEIAVECSGRSYRLTSRQPLTIGRGDDNDIVSSNPTVSRHHARIEHDGTHWIITDTQSAHGMHIGPRRVAREALVGTTVVMLGDAHAGERLVIAAPGIRPSPPDALRDRLTRHRRALPLVAFALAALLALAGWGLWSVLGPRSADRDVLARGTVRITASDWSGSGTIIDKTRGLVLTNAHVAAPLAPGLGVRYQDFLADMGEDAKDLTVEIAPGLDQPAVPTFTAKLVAADGYTDLAVIKLTGLTKGGDLAGALAQLEEIPIGKSKEVRSGDRVTVVGFPGVADSKAATFTAGLVSGRRMSPRIPDQPYEFNSDVKIAPGNSGGLVADERGRLVAVPTVMHHESGGDINGLVPVDLAAPLIAKAVAGEEYVSPWVHAPGLTITAGRLSGGAHEAVGTGCVDSSRVVGEQSVTVSIDYTGLEATHPVDILARAYAVDGNVLTRIGGMDSESHYPVKLPAQGCVAIGLGLDAPIGAGTYLFRIGFGPNHEVVYESKLTLK